MPRYDFTITIGAVAETPEEAWEKAVKVLIEDGCFLGSMPSEYSESEEEID